MSQRKFPKRLSLTLRITSRHLQMHRESQNLHLESQEIASPSLSCLTTDLRTYVDFPISSIDLHSAKHLAQMLHNIV
ncbi:hypothetical protein PFISCL1PPCAC_5524, partial [Pristionchus fissidentatus]